MTLQPPEQTQPFEPVESFQFMEPFPDDTNNGLYLNDFYFPEEVMMVILSHVEPKQMLRLSEVCKKWHNIIKSTRVWAEMYHREYHKKPKQIPWYVYYAFFSTGYFNRNFIKNGNGQEDFDHWEIVVNLGDQFRIMDPQSKADSLPANVPEFNNKTSYFSTSYYECNKRQEVSFESSRLMLLILNRFKPHIYLSEWTTARVGCGCTYDLWCKLYGGRKPKQEDENDGEEEEALHIEHTSKIAGHTSGSLWNKVELVVTDYPSGVKRVVFQHEGQDNQYGKGHYGSKMAGGVLKILFESIG